MKDLQVGEKFEFQGKLIKVVEETNKICCSDCFFFFNNSIGHNCNKLCKIGLIPECADIKREDGKSVVFIVEEE